VPSYISERFCGPDVTWWDRVVESRDQYLFKALDPAAIFAYLKFTKMYYYAWLHTYTGAIRKIHWLLGSMAKT
jgi:hypothetical protein